MEHEYKITVLGDTESSFDLSLTEDELNGVRKISEALAQISNVDRVSISIAKIE